MLKVGLIGLGKMGISHLSMINVHPSVDLVAICDTSAYMREMISRNIGIKAYADCTKMFSDEELDAAFISTPSQFHSQMVRQALDAGLHVFCEKPFVLDPVEGLSLAALAEERKLINQVGYHYRFVASFREAKRVLDSGILGTIHNIRSEAYGPVVLRPKGSSWRSQKSDGGGCLYDYACHAIDLMNYLVGKPSVVVGASLNSIFSGNVDDEVYGILQYADGASGIVIANWSDDSHRKMSTKVMIWGTNGKIVVDRQEIQVYLRDGAGAPEPYNQGWTIRYTTELTDPVWFYLRGEEYSAQIDHFVSNCLLGRMEGENTFRSATMADAVAAEIQRVAQRSQTSMMEANHDDHRPVPPVANRRFGIFSRK